MSKNVFVFCLLLSIFFYHLDFFPTFYNMQPVTSNAVAQQLQAGGFIKYKDVTVSTSANSYSVSGKGMLYKTLFNTVTEIGSGHTVIGILQTRSWSGISAVPYGFYMGNNGELGIWTTSQALNIDQTSVRIVYI